MSIQLGLFGNPVPVRGTIVVPVITDKPAVRQRAGTPLTPGAKRSIYGPGKYGKTKQHGVLDVAQRIYQAGGEKGNWIYRNLNLASLAMPVWVQIMDQADTLEMIDHRQNTCYSLPMAVARHSGTEYTAGFGPRIGWPLPWFDIRDANGRLLQAGIAPGR